MRLPKKGCPGQKKLKVNSELATGEDVIGFGFRFCFVAWLGLGDEVVLNFGGYFFGGLEDGDCFVGGFAQASEAAFAALVVGEGFEEMDAAEVRPEAVGDEDFSVGNLPEEEVGDALLAGGADDEIGVGHVR